MNELKTIREALEQAERETFSKWGGTEPYESALTAFYRLQARNPNIARILQNMIDEAEENLTELAQKMKGYEHLEHLDERRADLAEAVALVEELNEEVKHE